MNAHAIWRRLDAPGHDAALLTPTEAGWSLTGAAVFSHRGEPACVSYGVELDAGWRTRRGTVTGFLGGRRFDHAISRDADGWRLDGVLIEGLAHLVDLDYGFTPATNLQQLRRLDLAPGQSAAVDLAVAMRRNPKLRVLVGGGYYDLTTAPAEARHDLDIAGMPQDRLTFKLYESGHMLYIGDTAKPFSDDVRTLIRAAR